VFFDQEYIVCAAIWYKELPVLSGNAPIGHRNPVNIKDGIVVCGHRHGHCIHTMYALTGKRQGQTGAKIQGFLTSKNKFVTREEAAVIALGCGQITKLRYNQTRLFSEDIY
jgi:hypothetical protein